MYSAVAYMKCRSRINPAPLRRTVFHLHAAPTSSLPVNESSSEASVLVINASREMAAEMTMQLTSALPGCAITYAPSIELAKLILSKRHVDLIVSSPVLPDGSVQRLRESLDRLPSPPDIVVIGDRDSAASLLGMQSKYQCLTSRSLGPRKDPAQQDLFEQTIPPIEKKVQSLGADIRNDLNNPLQAIVAMVFVAKAAAEASPTTLQALDAIDTAAKNMANVVNALEGKIRGAVTR